MLVLSAAKSDEQHVYSLSQAGQPICTVTDEDAIRFLLLGYGVEEPSPLIAAARQWGVVEIHCPR